MQQGGHGKNAQSAPAVSSITRRKFGNNAKNMHIDEDMLDADELEQLAKEADEGDKGAKVSFLNGDAIRWMNKHRSSKNSNQAKHVTPSRTLQLRAIFRGLDFDNSGSISLDELKDAVKYVANNSSSSQPAIEDPDKMNKFFESMDADGSGSLDFEEFLFGMTSQAKESNDNDTQRLQEVFFDFANQHRRQMLVDKLKNKNISDLTKFEDLTRLFSIKFFRERTADEEGDAMDQLLEQAKKEKKEMITPAAIQMRSLEFERAKLAKIDLDRRRSLKDPKSFHSLVMNAGFPAEDKMDVSDRIHRTVSKNLNTMKIPTEEPRTVITQGLVNSRSQSEVQLKRHVLTTSRSLKALTNNMFIAPPVARRALLSDKKALLDSMYK